MEPDKAAEPVVPHERLVLDGLRAGNLPAIVTEGFPDAVSHR